MDYLALHGCAACLYQARLWSAPQQLTRLRSSCCCSSSCCSSSSCWASLPPGRWCESANICSSISPKAVPDEINIAVRACNEHALYGELHSWPEWPRDARAL